MSGEELLLSAKGFEKKLLNFFLRQGVSYFEGEDLAQEVLLRLWKYRNRYKATAKLSTFLFILARQVLIDFSRRKKRRILREELYVAQSEAVQMPVECVGDDIHRAVAKLSSPLRDVIELAVFQDIPYAEISQILEIPVGTVKSRMSNALKKLKEIVDER